LSLGDFVENHMLSYSKCISTELLVNYVNRLFIHCFDLLGSCRFLDSSVHFC